MSLIQSAGKPGRKATHGEPTAIIANARLFGAAADALEAGGNSPQLSKHNLYEAIKADAELCQAYFLWLDEEDHEKHLLALLREIIQSRRNRPPETRADAPRTHSNVTPTLKLGPSPHQLAADRAGRTKTYAAIYSAPETMIDGRLFYTFSYGEMKSLIPSWKRKSATVRHELALLEFCVGYGKPADESVSAADMIPERAMKQFLAKAKKEGSHV